MDEPRVKILHIDDNETNRYVVTRILGNAGFTVIEAATGTEGLEAVSEHQPDLVVLDVKLPDLGGFEVCRQIKANPETTFIPVLHLSASFVQSQHKAEGLESGADAYLAQPVEPIELVATVRSLLRIRRAEELALSSAREWQTTFDAIHDSVCLVDQDGKILRCNRAMSQLLGRPLHEILGHVHHELIQSSLGCGDGSCFRLANASHQRQVLELQSQERWFAKTIDPVLDENSTFTGAVCILSDITARKRAEALLHDQNDRLNRLMVSLQQQTEQAQQANRIKDEFLAVLSHELRSPLNPILGWTKILQKNHQDETKTQYALDTIERNAKLQTQLIEDLLDVSRILRGKLSLHTMPVSLAFTIQAALETAKLAAEAKSIQIKTEVAANVGQVLGDSGRLQQVVWNLLSNAVKFTPQGGQVQVQLAQVELERLAARETLQFYPPLPSPPQTPIPYVFDYFRQADSTTTRRFGGLGLGLEIVRHLIELHGGTVYAASGGEGQGAVFIVKLPIIVAISLYQDTNLAQNRSELNLNRLNILFVDDDQDSREMVTFLLKEYGANVTEADSASNVLNNLS